LGLTGLRKADDDRPELDQIADFDDKKLNPPGTLSAAQKAQNASHFLSDRISLEIMQINKSGLSEEEKKTLIKALFEDEKQKIVKSIAPKVNLNPVPDVNFDGNTVPKKQPKRDLKKALKGKNINLEVAQVVAPWHDACELRSHRFRESPIGL